MSSNLSNDADAPGFEDLLERFEDAWQANAAPNLADFLPAPGSPARLETLIELISIDLDHRRLPSLARYLEYYPELGPYRELPRRLIEVEYAARHRWGDRPPLEVFLGRFGGRADLLRSTLRDLEPELSGSAADMTGNGALRAESYPAGSAGSLLGPYRLFGLLGEGGMGRVYRARQEFLNRDTALKVLRGDAADNPTRVAAFRSEMEAVGRLDHPHIIRVYDAGAVDGTLFLAMELPGGMDLRRLVEREGPLEPERARDYARQAALGLQHAHERGVVHRDVKPSNLLVVSPEEGGLAPWGTVKLLDLGLARFEQRAGSGVGILGTADFMAPEQAEDPDNVGAAADLYGLGCTLYFFLTAKPPFPGGSFEEKMRRHRDELPAAVEHIRPDVSPDLAAAVARLLAKRPRDRFESAAAAALALKSPSAMDTVEIRAETTAVHPKPRRRRVRPSISWILGLLAAVAGVALVTSFLLPRRERGIVREYWLEVPGYLTEDIPIHTPPHGRELCQRFQGPIDWHELYGDHYRGFVLPPRTGEYTFWLASDDSATLWLSDSEDPADRKEIASVRGYTRLYEWMKYPTQRSRPIHLHAGQRYYVEALHKQMYEGDNFTVAWEGPGFLREVIPGECLAPWTGP